MIDKTKVRVGSILREKTSGRIAFVYKMESCTYSKIAHVKELSALGKPNWSFFIDNLQYYYSPIMY
jgi:hypothetical protein